MFAQAVPIGINLNSPVTWFVIAVGLIVLALAVSTRRATARPRSVHFSAPHSSSSAASSGALIGASQSALRKRFAGEWSAAQALFVTAPLAGSRQAQAIVDSLLHDSDIAFKPPQSLERRYRDACANVNRAEATTDELREAFLAFRAVSDVLLGESVVE